MTEAEASKWNAKYPAFYLSRYSTAQGKYILGSKPYSDIRNALKAAEACDKRHPDLMTVIDVKRKAS